MDCGRVVVKFSRNVGGADRIFRFGISTVMLYFGFINDTMIPDEIAAIILGVLGIIIMSTALFGACPLYDLVEFNSCTTHHDD